MRPIKLDEYGIDAWEYRELKAFCRQFPAKRRRARRDAAARDDVRLIRDTATQTSGGDWAEVLIDNVCYGVSFEHLDQAKMPTSNRNAFFRARREFFYLLFKAKNRR